MSTPGHDPKDIFAEALQLTKPEERAAYVEQACAGNPELRQEVESLLAAHDKAGDFLSHSVRLPEPKVALEHAGARIGRYKLLEQVGEGGFGVVWMAEQEEPVRRRVALKIIKLGMDTKEVVARFEAERQALAMMEHPNIARVFDGGPGFVSQESTNLTSGASVGRGMVISSVHMVCFGISLSIAWRFSWGRKGRSPRS